MARSRALHKYSNARKATADVANRLERDIFIAPAVKVMLIKNLHHKVGLVNEIMGKVIGLA